MNDFRRRMMMVTIAILAGAGALGFAGSKIGLFERLDGVYAEWSLRSRVEALCEARMEGDLKRVREFIIESCEPRAPIGNVVRYLEFNIHDIDIQERGVARIDMDASYKIGLPGFSSESDPPKKTTMPQRWVRVDGVWYWDPGPIPTSGIEMKRGTKPARRGGALSPG